MTAVEIWKKLTPSQRMTLLDDAGVRVWDWDVPAEIAIAAGIQQRGHMTYANPSGTARHALSRRGLLSIGQTVPMPTSAAGFHTPRELTPLGREVVDYALGLLREAPPHHAAKKVSMPKKTHRQLEREIAVVLKKRPRRHHATRQDAAADWDVAMDALLEHDPSSAAQIAASIREQRGIPPYAAITMDAPATFVNALEATPADVRDRFFKALKALQGKRPKPKPGSPEFTEKAPGVMTLYVPGHGYFSASAPTYLRYKRMLRGQLLKKVLQIYEGTDDDGAKPAHWRGYDKDHLAMIVADAYGDDA